MNPIPAFRGAGRMRSAGLDCDETNGPVLQIIIEGPNQHGMYAVTEVLP